MTPQERALLVSLAHWAVSPLDMHARDRIREAYNAACQGSDGGGSEIRGSVQGQNEPGNLMSDKSTASAVSGGASVSEEAVEAASKAWFDLALAGGGSTDDQIRAALQAAAPILTKDCAEAALADMRAYFLLELSRRDREIERLKAVLKKIAKMGNSDEAIFGDAVEFATRALNGQG